MPEKNKPTDEQVKEFWDKLDCIEIKQFPTTHPLTGDEVMIDAYVWKPTGQRLGHQIGSCDFPLTDLNNLSRYAIPKLKEKYPDSWKGVLHEWARESIGDYEQDTLSLYWLMAQTLP